MSNGSGGVGIWRSAPPESLCNCDWLFVQNIGGRSSTSKHNTADVIDFGKFINFWPSDWFYERLARPVIWTVKFKIIFQNSKNRLVTWQNVNAQSEGKNFDFEVTCCKNELLEIVLFGLKCEKVNPGEIFVKSYFMREKD